MQAFRTVALPKLPCPDLPATAALDGCKDMELSGAVRSDESSVSM